MDEDYAQAAAKHLKDASALLSASRWDGASYLAGYVVECTLKAMLEAAGVSKSDHSLRRLKDELNRVAALRRGARSLTPTQERILNDKGFYRWYPTIRYQGEGHYTNVQAQGMVEGAKAIYQRILP